MQGTDRINTITNIVFVLADVLEANLINMQEEFKKNGFELRHEVFTHDAPAPEAEEPIEEPVE